ncbi:DUF2000 family protein [Sphaerisporangium corydalis]|uniref:DUF2000 family protein n=1 Tax=Sphaerisporangium corydalis TaxID=1441875 RepID=A0ABV9EFG6_9ACTN|nr:DUF2000 family protein [Sphaerisporangium corydalis]
MRFDTKIGIVVREDLAIWQKLNVTAFLASAVAAEAEDAIGEPYADASGNAYLAMFRQPVLIYSADGEGLATVHTRALSRGLATAVYIEEMFKTGHDAANRATVEAHPAPDLPLVGLAIYGPRNPLDKTLKGLTLHP